MKLERILSILNNEDYIEVKEDRFSVSHWYDVITNNGGKIRVERLPLFFNKSIYRIYLFVPEKDKAITWWSFDHKSEYYKVVKDIYYDLHVTDKADYSKYF